MSVKIKIDKKMNRDKLVQELAEGGFFETSYRPEEYIIVEDSDDEVKALDIYKKHDPTPIPVETLEETITRVVDKLLKEKK